MNYAEVMGMGDSLIKEYLPKVEQAKADQSFLRWCDAVYLVIEAYFKDTQDDNPWLIPFLRKLAELRGDYESIVSRDPAVAYRPLNSVSEAFHRSEAYIRYFRAGNRTSKTQSGVLEDYWVATGQHPYRVDPTPGNVFIVAHGTFKDYLEKVFEPKFITGEPGNPVAPLFPEDGKWFNHYDSRKHTLTIACPECAEEGRAQQCPSWHPKTHIWLFSTENHIRVLEGFAAKQMHCDEAVDEEYFNAGSQRLGSVRGSRIIITATPLRGMDFWLEKKIASLATGDPKKNLADPEKGIKGSPKYAELFEISMLDAGVVDPAQVKRQMKSMDDFEIEARIYGRPAPIAANPVFNRKLLQENLKECTEPKYVKLVEKVPIVDLYESAELNALEVGETPTCLKVWEQPEQNGIYLIAADTAQGISEKHDASCAQVLKLGFDRAGNYTFEQVAQFYGWLTVLDYADELKRIGVWYNYAPIAVELTGGHGSAVMHKLKDELLYWNLHRETTGQEKVEPILAARLGVDTTQRTKPAMISSLQHYLQYGRVKLRDEYTVRELVAFEQVRSDAGIRYRYQGAGGSRDDRVMALAIGVFVGHNNESYFYNEESMIKLDKENSDLEDKDEQTRLFWESMRARDKQLKNPDPFA